MKKIIWKFPLTVTDIQQVQMPIGYEILAIQTQDDIPCIWALVDPNNPKINVSFEMFGTGVDINTNNKRKYIGTVQVIKFLLTVHCFEIINL